MRIALCDDHLQSDKSWILYRQSSKELQTVQTLNPFGARFRSSWWTVHQNKIFHTGTSSWKEFDQWFKRCRIAFTRSLQAGELTNEMKTCVTKAITFIADFRGREKEYWLGIAAIWIWNLDSGFQSNPAWIAQPECDRPEELKTENNYLNFHTIKSKSNNHI